MTRTISKLATELDINVETIRFYERRGLISQPPKPDTGYRHYSDEIVSRIRFIKRAQQLGFTLDEISNLLSLHDNPCHEVQTLAQQKLLTVKEKINDLHKLERALDDLVTQCQQNQDDSHCPIIDSLLP